MKNKSAVEWFFGQSLELTLQLSKRRISHSTWELEMVKISEQAKEMEKEQMEKMYNHAMWALVDGNGHGESFEEHFNNTFNK